MDLHNSRKGSTQNSFHAIAFKMVIRILFSLSSVKSLCTRYTRTAMNDVNCTPMIFIYNVCPIMLMGATGAQEVIRIQHMSSIPTRHQNSLFLFFYSILNQVESVIHKRRLSKKFLMSLATVPVFWGCFLNSLVSKVNGLYHKYVVLTLSLSLSMSFGWSCHVSSSL